VFGFEKVDIVGTEDDERIAGTGDVMVILVVVIVILGSTDPDTFLFGGF